jgi:2-dehydropantoate 2-reductase
MNTSSPLNFTIGIIGLGSIGCLIASQIPKSVHCFALLRNEEKKINFVIHDERQSSSYELVAWQGEPLDVIIICCKASQCISALDQWKKAINPNTQLVIFQNGFGQQDLVHQLFPNNALFAASTTEGANRTNRYNIRHAGIGITQWGHYAGPYQPLKLKITQLTGKHVKHKNIKQVLLEKLAINAVINPLTVKYNCTNGELLTAPAAFNDFEKLCAETQSLFTQMGWLLSFNLFTRAQQVAKLTQYNISSMLQDVRNQQQTEIDFINGHLINSANNNGFSLPINQELVKQIKELFKA